MTQTWPPWSPSLGYRDEHDYLSGDPREWGIDVALPAGTSIVAPEPGTVTAYQASNTDWEPGRLLLRLDRGGVIAFGHVRDIARAGAHVNGGQQVAAIGDLGSNSHVEFMYSPSSTAGSSRGDFTSFSRDDARSPFSVLRLYMTSAPPPPPPLHSDQVAVCVVMQPNTGDGYTMDFWGGLHPIGAMPKATATPRLAYWPGWNNNDPRGIAADCQLRDDGTGGYILDGWGGIHPFAAKGAQPNPVPAPGSPAGIPYWSGWYIARRLWIFNWDTPSGYTLDGWGGIHEWGGAPKVTGAYWPGGVF
jgi:hypothetical protein